MESPRKTPIEEIAPPKERSHIQETERNLLSEMKARREFLANFIRKNQTKLDLLQRAVTEGERGAYKRIKLCKIQDFPLNGINLDNLRSFLSESFMDPDVMEMMKCLITSVVTKRKYAETPEDARDHLERIRHWIRKLKLITSGSYGRTMTAQIHEAEKDSDDKDLVLKLPQEEYISDNLFHEMMVGLLALNNLRAYVPNFVYVYGGFSCAYPLIDKEGYVTTYCEHENDDIQYVLYENLFPSERMDKFLLSATRSDLLNILLQLSFSLDLARRTYDYFHGDLHAGNVLARDLGGIFAIPYSILTHDEENDNPQYKTIYINTSFVATVIDYGFSHFIVGGSNYGYLGAIERDVFPDKGFPAYDLFKFLISVYKWSGRKSEKGHNEEIGELAIDIINEFFEPEIDIEEILRAKIYSSLPLLPRTPKYEALTYSSFIEFILAAYLDELRGIYSETVRYPLLSCNPEEQINDEQCPRLEELFAILDISADNIPSDPYEFMDFVKSIKDDELRQEIIENYDYRKGLLTIRIITGEVMQNLKRLLNSTPEIKLKTIPIDNKKQLLQYRESVDNVGRIINEIATYDTYERAYNFLIDIMKPYVEIEMKKLNSEWLDKVREKLRERINQIREDAVFAKEQMIQGSIIYANLYDVIRWF